MKKNPGIFSALVGLRYSGKKDLVGWGNPVKDKTLTWVLFSFEQFEELIQFRHNHDTGPAVCGFPFG